VTKKERAVVFAKYGGRCAYCGCELLPGWHVDHLKPIRRKLAYDQKSGSMRPTGGCRRPKNECMNNYMPACASCNINKHTMSLEDFRRLVAGFVNSLNRYSPQYRIAKRFGFIEETVKPVVFYFEIYQPPGAALQL
jgi:5-methylcytosine-specific restriction endonuclease McrA